MEGVRKRNRTVLMNLRTRTYGFDCIRLDGEDGRSEEENQNSINELELRVKGQSEALSDLKLQLEKSEKKYNKEKSALVK